MSGSPNVAVKKDPKQKTLQSLIAMSGLFTGPSEDLKAFPLSIEAESDYEAVFAWLNKEPERNRSQTSNKSQRLGTKTYRAYQKEAERFVLWSIVEKRRSLRMLKTEDCAQYCAFLNDPQPAAFWCTKKRARRWEAGWAPFAGPLSGVAQEYAIAVVTNFCAFLQQRGYLAQNPWNALPDLDAGRRFAMVKRFTDQEWAIIEMELNELDSCLATERLRLLFCLLAQTGMRASEAVQIHISDIQNGPHEQYTLRINSQRNSGQRTIPISAHLAQQALRYAENSSQCADAPVCGTCSALLLFPNKSASLGHPETSAVLAAMEGLLYEQFRRFFYQCAQAHPHMASRFRAATPTWIRHSYVARLLEEGMPTLEMITRLGFGGLRAVDALTPPLTGFQRQQACQRYFSRTHATVGKKR